MHKIVESILSKQKNGVVVGLLACYIFDESILYVKGK